MDNGDYQNDTFCLEKIVEQLNESNVDVLMFGTIDCWRNEERYVYPTERGSRNNVVEKK